MLNKSCADRHHSSVLHFNEDNIVWSEDKWLLSQTLLMWWSHLQLHTRSGTFPHTHTHTHTLVSLEFTFHHAFSYFSLLTLWLSAHWHCMHISKWITTLWTQMSDTFKLLLLVVHKFCLSNHTNTTSTQLYFSLSSVKFLWSYNFYLFRPHQLKRER